MAADETTQRWWQEMHPCQQPLQKRLNREHMDKYGGSISPGVRNQNIVMFTKKYFHEYELTDKRQTIGRTVTETDIVGAWANG